MFVSITLQCGLITYSDGEGRMLVCTGFVADHLGHIPKWIRLDLSTERRRAFDWQPAWATFGYYKMLGGPGYGAVSWPGLIGKPILTELTGLLSQMWEHTTGRSAEQLGCEETATLDFSWRIVAL